jgi:hypothetical protein
VIFQLVQVCDVGKEHCPCNFRARLQAVHVDFFVFPIVSSQADDVALIGHNKDQAVLTKASLNRRIFLPDSITCFDGERDVLTISELKADNRVARKRDSPVRQEEVGGLDL